MSGEPIQLHAVRNEPPEGLVEKLEEVLEDARAGKIRAFALVAINDDNSWDSIWNLGAKGPLTVLGGVSLLQSNLIAFNINHEAVDLE
jgi:uncharacterized protein (DUF1800 family)